MTDQTPVRTAVRAELAAIRRILDQLDQLDVDAQHRVLQWVADWYRPARERPGDQQPKENTDA